MAQNTIILRLRTNLNVTCGQEVVCHSKSQIMSWHKVARLSQGPRRIWLIRDLSEGSSITREGQRPLWRVRDHSRGSVNTLEGPRLLWRVRDHSGGSATTLEGTQPLWRVRDHSQPDYAMAQIC